MDRLSRTACKVWADFLPIWKLQFKSGSRLAQGWEGASLSIRPEGSESAEPWRIATSAWRCQHERAVGLGVLSGDRCQLRQLLNQHVLDPTSQQRWSFAHDRGQSTERGLGFCHHNSSFRGDRNPCSHGTSVYAVFVFGSLAPGVDATRSIKCSARVRGVWAPVVDSTKAR